MAGGRATRMESLGWLTESAVMPKKRKIIEGVGASSIVELKAQLYRTQEETRNTRESTPNSSEYLHAKKKILLSGPLSHKNSGVEERDKRDKLELKALKDGSVSYAVLEKKAELYEKLVRGELPDEEEKEKYCVDFFQKNVTKVESQQPEGMDTASCCSERNEDCVNDGSIPNLKPFSLGRTSAALDSDEHKRFVREVHQDASDAREKSMMLKLRRQEQEAVRRQKLRQAFLRKQLEKLTSTNQKSAGDEWRLRLRLGRRLSTGAGATADLRRENKRSSVPVCCVWSRCKEEKPPSFRVSIPASVPPVPGPCLLPPSAPATAAPNKA